MKLHRGLLMAVGELVHQVVFGKAYADKLIAALLKSQSRWGKRDRSFVVETTQDVLRHFRLLATISGQNYTDAQLDMQLVLAAWALKQGYELPDWEEWKKYDITGIHSALLEPLTPTDKYSMPDWLYELGKQQLGERWDDELAALNQPAKLVIRVNTLRTTKEKLRKLLADKGIVTENIVEVPDALQLPANKYLLKLPEYETGLFEIQDAASQMVAPYLEVAPGMTVIDACAGGGGKTLHLANLMQNKGNIIACDVEPIKLKSLERRLQRAQVPTAKVQLIDKNLVASLKHKADRVLLDVPCTGLGVLKRNPDTKWLLSPDSIAGIEGTQREILASYHTMLKPGGKLVYATCSILPSEDAAQVQWFLQQQPEYTLLKEQYLWPSQFGYDGFYMALLEKGG
ncbi:MAG: RsmB/NOP family class I SAM-dependent RNA methyltransferase [Chitinophagales bacterium]|nr:RsmB/NOP family class I SAM-dependent RNA methyltransferase [Chitinophagales bacterium]